MLSLKDYFIDLVRNRKANLIVYSVYLLYCLTVFVYFLVIGNISTAFSAIVYGCLVLAVYLFEVLSDLRVPWFLLILFLIIPTGAILGSNFDFYIIFPWFDDFLHTLSGFLFACIGFGLFSSLSRDINPKKQFMVSLLGGFCFSLACALVWELYEYFSSSFFGFDMQEDSLTTAINSYYLSGTHEHGMLLENITKTIIYYGDNQTYVIEGGYLDTGLFDTLMDLIVCFIGSLVYGFLVLVGKKHKFYNKFCPTLKKTEETTDLKELA